MELPPSARLLGIGFYVAIAIILPTFGGLKLDEALDTGRLCTVVGLVIGLVLALWGGYSQLMEVLADINRRRTEGKRSE